MFTIKSEAVIYIDQTQGFNKTIIKLTCEQYQCFPLVLKSPVPRKKLESLLLFCAWYIHFHVLMLLYHLSVFKFLLLVSHLSLNISIYFKYIASFPCICCLYVSHNAITRHHIYSLSTKTISRQWIRLLIIIFSETLC